MLSLGFWLSFSFRGFGSSRLSVFRASMVAWLHGFFGFTLGLVLVFRGKAHTVLRSNGANDKCSVYVIDNERAWRGRARLRTCNGFQA